MVYTIRCYKVKVSILLLFMVISCSQDNMIDKKELLGKYELIGSDSKNNFMYLGQEGYKIVSNKEIIQEGECDYTTDGFYDFTGYMDIKPEKIDKKIILPLKKDRKFLWSSNVLFYRKVSDEEYSKEWEEDLK